MNELANVGAVTECRIDDVGIWESRGYTVFIASYVNGGVWVSLGKPR